MSQLLEAFVLGNSVILTNVCVLPLYPSVVAYLAADAGRARGWSGVLGVLVLVVGLALFLLQAALEAAYANTQSLRNSFAHGRGAFERLGEDGLWEQVSALGAWLDSRAAPNEAYRNRDQYLTLTRLAGEKVYRDVSQVMRDLDAAIDWDAVKARKP